MMPLLLALALSLSGPRGAIAQADRNRFPPDDVLSDYRCAAATYGARIDADLPFVLSPTSRARMQAALRECQRIGEVCMWLRGFGHAAAEDKIFWMAQAKGLMTEEEYAGGFLPFGGVPQY